MTAYLSAMARFGDFDGHSKRLEFWLYFVVLAIISAGVQYAAIRSQTKVPIVDLVRLIHVVPTTTLQIRRLHDTGRTGWWLLLALTVVGIIPLLIWFCQKSKADGRHYLGGPSNGSRTEPVMDTVGPGLVAAIPNQAHHEALVSAVTLDRSTLTISWLWPIGLAVVGGVVVALTVGRNETDAFVRAFLDGFEKPAAANAGQLVEAFKARGLDKVVVVSNSGAEPNGEPLLVVAACMAGKNAFGEPRNVAFYDEGSRNYRLVMTDPGKEAITYHFELILPGIVRFDSVASSSESSDNPGVVEATLYKVILPCSMAKK